VRETAALRLRRVLPWVAGALLPCLPALGAEQLEEVTVSARRQIDARTLEHVVIPRFVAQHGMPNPKINQIGRWHSYVCPMTVGLQALPAEFVSRRIVAVARGVGAPTKRAGECRNNVQVVFTPKPQQVLEDIRRTSVGWLGYANTSIAKLATISHPIQAWYVTGTRSYNTQVTQVNGDGSNQRSTTAGLILDSDANIGASGRPGSHLGDDLTSEIVNVLVIADSNQLSGQPLAAIADYIAMLVLTRTSLGGCNELPSITDLLSPDCGSRPRPESLTDADTAYLKALYASNLALKVNLERGEMHDRMLQTIEGKQ